MPLFLFIFHIFFLLFLTYIHSFNHIHTIHLSVAIRWDLTPSLHRLKAQWEDPPCGAESGQKQSVKLLQNMVYNTNLTSPPTLTPPPSPTATNCLYILYITLGGGGQREDRGATAHKDSSLVHRGNSSQAGS
jgi:hypothetical protein